MLNIMEQHICYLIINTLKKAETSLTFREIKRELGCKIDDIDLDLALFYMVEQGNLQSCQVLRPYGMFTAWRISES